MDSEGPKFEKRRTSRKEVNIICAMRVDSAVWQKDRLSNLTPEGFCIVRTAMCRVGGKVWIKIGDLAQLPAEIRWVEGGYAGCHFDNPLADYVFDHVVSVAERS